jgi:hypothetical protein
MASIVEQMTAVSVCVADYRQAHPDQAHWRRSPHHDPDFTDAEVITIALLQGCLGVATLKQAYHFVAANHPSASPHLPSYAQWLAPARPLGARRATAPSRWQPRPGQRTALLPGQPADPGLQTDPTRPGPPAARRRRFLWQDELRLVLRLQAGRRGFRSRWRAAQRSSGIPDTG